MTIKSRIPPPKIDSTSTYEESFIYEEVAYPFAFLHIILSFCLVSRAEVCKECNYSREVQPLLNAEGEICSTRQE